MTDTSSAWPVFVDGAGSDTESIPGIARTAATAAAALARSDGSLAGRPEMTAVSVSAPAAVSSSRCSACCDSLPGTVPTSGTSRSNTPTPTPKPTPTIAIHSITTRTGRRMAKPETVRIMTTSSGWELS